MKVSIITICYDSSSYIRSAIESVLFQSYTDIEYIVIDGGSSDGTQAIINEYADRIDYIASEPDQGIYDAMNKGLSQASGEVIGILNSDDFYPNPEVINEIVQILSTQSDVDMVLGNVDFVSTSNLTKIIRLYSSLHFAPWKLRFGFMPPHPGTFIRKSAYEQVGLYKLGYKIGADFDMFVRMLLVYKLSYVKLNKTLVRMRLGGVSTSGLTSYMTSTKEMLRSLDENKIYSNMLMVLVRLPIKFVQQMLPNLRS